MQKLSTEILQIPFLPIPSNLGVIIEQVARVSAAPALLVSVFPREVMSDEESVSCWLAMHLCTFWSFYCTIHQEPFLAQSLECLKDVNCRLVSYDMRSNAEALDSHDFVSHC